MSDAPLLEIKGLSKSFGGVRALYDVSLEVMPGELLGVIGPNGSGKTTLVNLITRFVKPTSGTVLFKGRKISHLPPYKIVRLGIARTFQMVKPFYQLLAYKNMIIPLCSPRMKQFTEGGYGDRDAIALDLLEEVGFERDAHAAYKMAGALPQGYLKRLELAKAIALQPDLLILDELFSGLSLAEVASIVPIIEKIRLQGKTIIMIEHRLKELFRIADRIMVMNFGQKIAQGSAESVMENEAVKNAYLGTETD